MTETETRIEELEAENEELCERLDRLESALEAETDEDGNGITPKISRRGTLTALAGAGVIGLGATGAASAEPDDFEDAFTGEHVYTAEDGTSGPFTFAVVNGGDDVDGDDFGDGHAVLGVTRSSSGVAFAGEATSSHGDTRGLEGRVQSPDGDGLFGTNASDGSGDGHGVLGRTSTTEGSGVFGRNENPDAGANAYGVWGEVDSDDGVGIGTPDDCWIGGRTDIDEDLHVWDSAMIHDDLQVVDGGDIHIEDGGNITVEGTKHFVHAVETPVGNKKVRYTSVEAGKALTEVSEVAEMEDGRAEIELPEHFEMVTSDEEPLSVQVTPYAKEEVQPQVVEQSTDCIVVEDFSDTDYDYTFAYTVKGVREGFEDEEIVIDDE